MRAKDKVAAALVCSSALAALAFFVMALVSFSYFTTLGIDSDRGDLPFVLLFLLPRSVAR